MAMIKRGSSISGVTVINNWGKHNEPSIADGTLEILASIPAKKKKASKAK